MGASTTGIKKFKKRNEEEVGLEATVIALREELMAYFKGDCINRFADADISLVRLADYSETPRQQFLRRKVEEQDRRLVVLAGVPILTIHHRPDVVVFHMGVLERSKQFRRIHKELVKFLSKHLPGIKKEESHANIIFK